LVDQQRTCRDVLGHELDRTMHDGIGEVALARKRCIVARCPARSPATLEGDQMRGPRGLGLGRTQEISDLFKHRDVLLCPAFDVTPTAPALAGRPAPRTSAR